MGKSTATRSGSCAWAASPTAACLAPRGDHRRSPRSGTPRSSSAAAPTARRTGDIALFKITTEAAVAAGIRRIEALTGEAAYEHVKAEERLLGEAAGALRVAPDQLPERVQALIGERRRLEQEIGKLRQQLATGGGAAAIDAKEVAGVPFFARALEDVPAQALRGMADQVLSKAGSGVVAVVGRHEGKASLVVSVSKDLIPRISAVELVRAGVAELGGKGGGGRPDFAQGGGPDGARAEAALAAIERNLARQPAAAE